MGRAGKDSGSNRFQSILHTADTPRGFNCKVEVWRMLLAIKRKAVKVAHHFLSLQQGPFLPSQTIGNNLILGIGHLFLSCKFWTSRYAVLCMYTGVPHSSAAIKEEPQYVHHRVQSADYNWRHKQLLYLYGEVEALTPSLYHKTAICWKDASNRIIGKSWVKYPPQWILLVHHSAGLHVMTER